VKAVTSTSSVLLDAEQALAFGIAGLKVAAPLGDIVSLSDVADNIESLTIQQIQALESVGITEIQMLNSAATNAVQALALSVSQFSALQSAGIKITVPVGNSIAITDSASQILNALSRLQSEGLSDFTVVDTASYILADLSSLKKQIANLSVTVRDTASRLAASFSQLTAQLASARIKPAFNVSDSISDLLQAASSGLIAQLKTDVTQLATSISGPIALSWYVQGNAALIHNLAIVNSATSQISSLIAELIGSGVQKIQLQVTDASVLLSAADITSILNAAGGIPVSIEVPAGAFVTLSDTAAVI
jgi:hypothetical protein